MSFLTVELMAQILQEFEWPAEYELIDDLPDGIIVSFPKSNFVFMDGMNGQIVVKFLVEDTHTTDQLDVFHALLTLVPESERSGPLLPELTKYTSPFMSRENTQTGIRNNCNLILANLGGVISGDFSWVKKYEKMKMMGMF